jgi:ataxia telangiectasia mutated family protein
MTPQQVATVTLRYAQFADQQFQAMNKSQYIKQLERSTERQLEEVAALKRHLKNPSSADRDAYETLRLMQKESQRDSDILKRHQADRLEFLRAALSLYAKIVASGESHDNLVLRFCAIWLDTELDDDTNIYIQKALKEIPSHKFVDLAYQLTARLRFSENNSEPFRNNIHALVTRICAQHPFHIIYQVLTLAAPAMKSSRRVSTMAGDRERAAFAILNQVRLSSKRREEIDQMEKFARTAISWAKEDSGRKGKDGNYTVIKDSPILTLQNMVIPVPTLTLPVDPTGAYKGLVALQRYNDRFALAGGIHRPKIMTCVGSDGSLNRELVG